MLPEEKDSPTPFDQIGGDAKGRELVDRFYDLMDSDRFGHPMSKARHLPFAIGTADWMRNQNR